MPIYILCILDIWKIQEKSDFENKIANVMLIALARC